MTAKKMKTPYSPPYVPPPAPVVRPVAPVPVVHETTHTEAMALNIVTLNSEVAAIKAQLSAVWRALGGPTRVG